MPMLPTMGGGGPSRSPFRDVQQVKAPARPKAPAKPKAPSRSSRSSTPAQRYTSAPVRSTSGRATPRAVSVKAPVPPAAPKTPSSADWLKGDATYQAMLASLAKNLSNYNTDLDTQVSNYGTDYGNSLKDLGYLPGADGAAGTWDWTNPLSAAGRGNENLVNDFAARGMLQSTGYADAQNQLQTSLMDQLNQMNTARDQFNQGIANQRSAYSDQNASARQNAQAESIARRAAKYGLT